MEAKDARATHQSVDLLRLRAHATAVGLLQLTTELVRAKVLDQDAVDRIKDAIAGDLALSRPPAMSAKDFDTANRRRLDALFAGQEKISDESKGALGSPV